MNVTHYNNVTHLVALCKSALVSFFFFCTSVSVSSYCITADPVEPLAVLLRVASGENQLVQIYEKIVCERARTRVGAIIIMNASNALKTFIFHTYSPLPVVEKSTLIVYLSPSRSRSKVSAELRRVWSACGGEYKNSLGDKWVCLCLYENVAFALPEG